MGPFVLAILLLEVLVERYKFDCFAPHDIQIVSQQIIFLLWIDEGELELLDLILQFPLVMLDVIGIFASSPQFLILVEDVVMFLMRLCELFFEIFGVLKFLDKFGVGLDEFDFEELGLWISGLLVFDGVVKGVIVV